jgi:hypothetical protein
MNIKNGHVQETIQFEWDNLILVGGIPTPLKNGVKVSWDYCSQYVESNKIHVPNHQPVEIK